MKKAVIKPIGIFVLLAICAFVLMIALNVNISNIRSYDMYIPNNIAASEATTIGRARAIRSDEWLVESSNTFYETYNPTHVNSVPDVIVKLVDIRNWTNELLSGSRVFAYKSLWGYLLLFVSVLFFFNIFEKKNWIFVLCSAIIITMQPGIAWWNSAGTYAIFFALIDMFYYFFYNKEMWKKILCCIGMIICMGYYIVNAYPAWMIPLGYLAALLLIGTFLEKRQKIQKSDIPYIVITIIAMIGVAACYLISKADFINAVSNTEYPGKRFSVGGGIDFDYIIHYLLIPLAPLRDIPFINNSEASTFYSFFPIPFILYFAYRRVFKGKKIISLSLVFAIVCYFYAFFGIPRVISKVTLWSYTTAYRVCIIGDLAMLIALIFEIYFISAEKEINVKIVAIANLIEIVFLVAVYFISPRTVEYLGIVKYCAISLFSIIILNAIILRYKKIALIMLLSISIATSIIVNPVNIGSDIIEATPLAKEISLLEKEDSGNWITTNDWIISKYIKAQGAECLNALNYPPALEQYRPFDTNGENSNIYNRYSHVVLLLEEKPVEFKLIYADRFEMRINSEVLTKWQVKYIVSKEEINTSNESLSINKVYSDLDGYDIYKVNYK